MSATQQFMEQQSGINDSIDLDATRTGFVSPLADTALLAASGQDAASLLHRLLTNDVERMKPVEARLNGLCSPKGRLLASFLTYKSGDTILLQLPVEMQATIYKRLQMFVMRDKAEFVDASNDYALLGLGGTKAETSLKTWFSELPSEPYTLVTNDSGTLIRVADAFGAARYEWLMPPTTLANIWPALTADLTPCTDAAWRLAEIDAGLPSILTATQEQFVPQMVNYELVGGVSFKKGCFIGQEIVARTQYLGKTVRRMLPATINGTVELPLAGMDVYSSNDPSQPCGMIVNAERTGDNSVACLVSLRLDATESGTLHLGEASGPSMQLQSLPYEFPTEQA